MANEKRLISSDDLQKVIDYYPIPYWVKTMLRKRISELLPTEAAPVVYGRWVYEPIEFTYEKDIKCSVCGGYAERTSNYCPNCGANMMDNAMEN